MNRQAFGILEFGSLRNLVRRSTQTEVGAARIDQLAPLADFEALQRELCATREMIALRQRAAKLSFEGIADPAESLARLQIEGRALEPLAILDLARISERAMDARAAIATEREVCPTLFEIVSALPKDLAKLAALIHRKILPSGE
ncbi:MAG TPA: hypothetical protein VGU64_00540, partial [Terriglobales bacterium]|nr:hypothetical protein [Terriglobales bacterium]